MVRATTQHLQVETSCTQAMQVSKDAPGGPDDSAAAELDLLLLPAQHAVQRLLLPARGRRAWG